MRRIILIISAVILVILAVAGYLFNNYWVHRYDELIERQAGIYRLNKEFVWSVIHAETYFRAWMIGADEEVGLMQVTPLVARQWAKETGMTSLEKQASEDVVSLLRDPERNIQVGCWYLEKLGEKYRGMNASEAMVLAAYNAGPSRVEEWTKGADAIQMSEEEFISRIGIPSTKAYVTSILSRYRSIKKSK
jgi:soluble lytic murein transglycosylase